ncbi:hypothetical protein MRX96_003051 [Rhipicephalus microplus]
MSRTLESSPSRLWNLPRQLTFGLSAKHSHTELERLLLKRYKRSSSGPDRFTHPLLRNLDAFQHPFLLDVFNSAFSRVILSDQWRSATVTPATKQGKPPHTVESYTHILLTSLVGKTMEEMALYRLQRIATPSYRKNVDSSSACDRRLLQHDREHPRASPTRCRNGHSTIP